MCAGGQTERHCGKVGGRSDESAPDDDSPEVYAAGQGHDRCYCMHMLDQINALVAVADALVPTGFFNSGLRDQGSHTHIDRQTDRQTGTLSLSLSYSPSLSFSLSPSLSLSLFLSLSLSLSDFQPHP